MAKQRNKTKEELEYVRLLCAQIDELRGAVLESLAAPEPDVLAQIGSCRFGIEVTEIHGNPRMRMIEGEQNRVLVGAEREWNQRGLPPVAVWLHWVPTSLPRRLARDLPAKLVDLLAARLPEHPKALELDWPEFQDELGADSGIEHIFLYTDWESPSAWELGRRWQGGAARPPLIQGEIDRKNPKPANYREAYDEKWLLLVHNGGNPSSGFDIGPDIPLAVYASTFDRVYLLSLIGPKALPIRLRPAPRSSNER